MSLITEYIVKIGGKVQSSFTNLKKETDELQKDIEQINDTKIAPNVDAKSTKKVSMFGKNIKETFDNAKQSALDFKNNAIGGMADDLGSFGSTAMSVFSKGGVWGAAVGAGVVALGAMSYKLISLDKEFASMRANLKLFAKDSNDVLKSAELAKSIEEQFSIPHDEIIKQAGSVAKAFGITTAEAMDKMRKSLILTSGKSAQAFEAVAEFAGPLEAMGATSEEAFNLITQATKEGIKPEKMFDGLKAASVTLREMSDSTQEALAGVGVDGKKMLADIQAGKMTTFEAQKRILASANKQTDIQKKQIALQTIFAVASEDISNKQLTAALLNEKSMADQLKNGDARMKQEEEIAKKLDERMHNQQEASKGMNEIAKDFQIIWMDLQDLFWSFMKTFSPILKLLMLGIKGFVKFFVDVFKTAFDWIGKIVDWIIDKINKAIKLANKFLGTNIKLINTTKDAPAAQIPTTEEGAVQNDMATVGSTTTTSTKTDKAAGLGVASSKVDQRVITFNIGNLLKVDEQNVNAIQDLKTLEMQLTNLLLNAINTSQAGF